MCQLVKRLGVAFVALLFCSLSYAQVTTSELNGFVLDESGEALVGATVLVTHNPSKTQYAAIANNKGLYTIKGMRSGGPYTVEISFLGMTTVKYDNIVLKLGEAYQLDAKMKASNELEALMVFGEKSFDSNITGSGMRFSQKNMEAVPTLQRSIYDLVKYTPQVQINRRGGVSFSGTNNRYNSFQIDGAIANDTFGLADSGTNGGQTGTNPIAFDAIEEIQITLAPFDIRQSGFTGGAINAITKAGTNSYTGSFYNYFNNHHFIGTTPGNIAKEKRKKYDKQYTNTLGVTAGGPILKDKLFYFVSVENKYNNTPNIFSPSNKSFEAVELKEEVDYEGTAYGKHFNEEMAAAIIDKYEKTYLLGHKTTGETFTPHSTKSNFINFLGRLDWNINKGNKLMFRFQFVDADADRYNSSPNFYYFNNSSHRQKNSTYTLVSELNSNIGSSFHNTFRASAVFVRDTRHIPYEGPTIYIQKDGTSAGNVSLCIGTEYLSSANYMFSNNFTFTDDLSYYIGNHELTLGTHNEFYSFSNLFLPNNLGTYTFNSISDFFKDKIAKFDYSYADPQKTGGNTRWAATCYAGQFSLYFQDLWKPISSLSLSLGLRADLPVLFNAPTQNGVFNSTPIAEKNNQYVGRMPSLLPLLSPRFGFRWFVDEKKNTLFRGGLGFFTGRVPFVWLVNAFNNNGIEAKSLSVKNPLPANFLPSTGDVYKDIVESGYAAAGKASINTISEDFRYPQTIRANFGFEQSFLGGWKFVFDGVFSKTINNVLFRNLAIKDQDGVFYAVNKASGNVHNTAPHYTVDGSYYAVIALDNTWQGYTYSLSGKLEKSFDFGLDLMAAYTFGHAYSLSDGTSSVAYSNWKYNNVFDPKNDVLSHSIFDRPHKINALVSYTSPLYANFLKTIVTLTYEGASGQRYSYTYNDRKVDVNGDGYGGNTLMYIPTSEDIELMDWNPKKPIDQQKKGLEDYINGDPYLKNNRGKWSSRFAAATMFENHFDLHIAQEFYYDKSKSRKVELLLDFINLGNLFNRTWGAYYFSDTPALSPLEITALSPDKVPTYLFNPSKYPMNDFLSRWRCQLGARITF